VENTKLSIIEKVTVGSKSNPTVSVEEDIGGVGAVSVGIGQGESLIPSPVKKKESTEAYYNEGVFDEDQELALAILRDEGVDLYPYVTPDNSPEQIFELGKAVELGIPNDKIKKMSDPVVPFMSLQVIAKAWKNGIDLTDLLPWADPFVLNQAFLGAKKGLDLSKFIKQGLDHRQIEQLRKELESGGNPDSLKGNYNQMRATRFPHSNISNIRPSVKN
jgi:hypothetical protein